MSWLPSCLLPQLTDVEELGDLGTSVSSKVQYFHRLSRVRCISSPPTRAYSTSYL